MATATPTETELKLQLDADHIDRLRSSAALSGVVRSEAEVDNVYFDTPDCLLRRHGMALRLRQIDGHWLQTLKTEGTKRGSLSHRGEWETPARVLRGKGQLDLARMAASPLPELLAKQKRMQALQPLFRTHFRRARWTVERVGATIEVALDVGEISACSDSASLREEICEVELELKEGEPAALIGLALELLGEDKASPALTPIARSKAERGYQLIAQQPAAAVKASAKGFVVGLTRRATTARALRTVVAHGLEVTTRNAEFLLRYQDVEYVHQARVALRRVRSAIRLFDRAHRDVPPALADELRWLASALGEVRDWDVIVEETLPSLSRPIGTSALKPLIARADDRRRQARQEIRETVRSARYAALVLKGERWCMTPDIGTEMLVDAAAPALRSASKKLFDAARFFAALTPMRRHQVRILAKRLRYALDAYSVALPRNATMRYIDVLSELQDVLGQLNDASVAMSVLPQLSRSVELKKAAQGWFASVEPDRVRNVEKRLLKLSKMQTPWT